MGASMDSYLNGYADPRRERMVQPATIDDGGFHGVRNGLGSNVQKFYADIRMPRAVEISVSDDNERFTTLATVENRVPFDFRQNSYREFGWTGEAQGRYIPLKALHNAHPGEWMFTDEIVVQ